MGLLNVQVLKTTSSITDSLTVASSSPYTVTLTKTPVNIPTIAGYTYIPSGSPTALQFAVSGATVTFNVAAAGLGVSPSYLYTTTTTYTPTGGATSALVRLYGGGGAGGGASGGNPLNYSVGSGGSSGGYAEYFIPSLSGSYAIVVGPGGIPVAGDNGGPGGNTIFTDGSTVITALGGHGGGTLAVGTSVTSVALGGDGACISTNGTLNAAGTSGGDGLILAQSIYTAPHVVGGIGGATSLGGNGYSQGVIGTSAGVDAVADTGSGGGGAINTNVSSGYAGGAGGTGVIIVEEYA